MRLFSFRVSSIRTLPFPSMRNRHPAPLPTELRARSSGRRSRKTPEDTHAPGNEPGTAARVFEIGRYHDFNKLVESYFGLPSELLFCFRAVAKK